MDEEAELQFRVDGEPTSPTLIYLPGLHGDWTLLPGFRELAKARFRLAQFTYPRTLSWSLRDYAQAVDQQLKTAGIRSGWILAESFSSQVAWTWLKQAQDGATDFRFEGMILAGGFVRYPMLLNLAAARFFFAVTPWWAWRLLFKVYLAYSGFRHRNAGPAGNCAEEFIARRTPLDLATMRARLRLIAEADLREVARKARCPIYQVAGVIDPVVPPAMVARWLRRNCRTFAGARVIWPADHNVLGTEPAAALAQIENWVSASSSL
ncbi:MAG TPA: alpha/beta hydrolase [Verrucomicrobiae bacterium]